jgi:hypothetical protein
VDILKTLPIKFVLGCVKALKELPLFQKMVALLVCLVPKKSETHIYLNAEMPVTSTPVINK